MNHEVLERLTQILHTRLPSQGGDPQSSYVAKLYSKGPDSFLKKLGEEAIEVILACKGECREEIIYESADLLFHLLTALTYYRVDFSDILNELARREGLSGLVEKASRQDK